MRCTNLWDDRLTIGTGCGHVICYRVSWKEEAIQYTPLLHEKVGKAEIRALAASANEIAAGSADGSLTLFKLDERTSISAKILKSESRTIEMLELGSDVLACLTNDKESHFFQIDSFTSISADLPKCRLGEEENTSKQGEEAPRHTLG